MAKDYIIDKVDKLNPAIYDRDPKNPGRKFIRLVAGENGFQAGEVIDQRGSVRITYVRALFFRNGKQFGG